MNDKPDGFGPSARIGGAFAMGASDDQVEWLGRIAVGACNRSGICSQTERFPARIGWQWARLSAHAICRRARNREYLLTLSASTQRAFSAARVSTHPRSPRRRLRA